MLLRSLATQALLARGAAGLATSAGSSAIGGAVGGAAAGGGVALGTGSFLLVSYLQLKVLQEPLVV